MVDQFILSEVQIEEEMETIFLISVCLLWVLLELFEWKGSNK